MTFVELLTASLIVAGSVFVQTLTGSGFGTLAAPLLLLAVPRLVPVPLLMLTVVVMASALRLDRHGLGRRELGPALVGCVPGATAGMALGSAVDGRWTAVVVGALVVASVAAGLGGWTVAQTSPSIAAAGAIGGALGSLAATPGPPVILVYRSADLVCYRANLALFFLVTSSVSLVGDVVVQGADASQALLAARLLPAVAAGAVVARSVRAWVRPEAVRPLALGLCLIAGLGLVGRGLAPLIG